MKAARLWMLNMGSYELGSFHTLPELASLPVSAPSLFDQDGGQGPDQAVTAQLGWAQELGS